jgi:hypothetical protein
MAPEKLEPLEIIQCLISKESIEEGTPIYNIQKEFMQWVILHADFFLQRYKQGIGRHWTENELKTTRIGLAGQKAFELMLQLIEVAYVPNDPVIDQRLQKDYDFFIPPLGKIEVKTYDYYCRKVLVKPSEWHGNDFLVVWKFRDKEHDSLQMVGWLTKEEVEAIPTTPKGKSKYTMYHEAKVIDMEDLRHPKNFITKLQKTKQQLS